MTNAASPLRAALMASVVRPGQWVGPVMLALAAGALALIALPNARAWPAATGWLAWIAFALSLGLTVRARPLAARFGGLDHQYAWHHVLGLVAYVTILVHALAVIWPPLLLREFRSAIDWWLSGPVALSGWVALALLFVPLAATFFGPADFRQWLRWHRITGPAFAVVAVHVALATGVSTPGWWAVALAGAAALAARTWVKREDAGRRYVVTQVEHPANACVEVELEPLDRALDVVPGQYVFVAFHSGERYHSCDEYHPFTVSRVRGSTITLTIKALGDCTLEMQRLSVGLAARVEGPFGAFFDQATAETPQLWIAGGIGITPFLAQLDRLGATVDLRMAYLYRRGEDALHVDELQSAAEDRPGMELFTLVSATDLTGLWSWLDDVDVTHREIYVCGPPPLLDAVVHYLEQRGVSETRVHFERFDFR
jgi:predicted ferric reductase